MTFQILFDHNVIHHLGLRLYKNRPTNVLAELLSNAWDADADNFWVDSNQAAITVTDDGHGMARAEIENRFLLIGAPKRRSDPAETSPNGRPLMGRKGIGKLAAFGIADAVDLISCQSLEEIYWLRFSVQEMLDFEPSDSRNSYRPVVILDGLSLDDASDLLDSENSATLQNFIKYTNQKGSGTQLILSHLTLAKSVSDHQIKRSLGRRFTVSLLRDDFNVFINGSAISESDALPDFDFRIPEKGMISDSIGGKSVRYWVGFVSGSPLPYEESGVGVYAHGKIAQDRPFYFQIPGKDVHKRYMYAVVEADWIDEFEEDLIGTDRSTIDWDNEKVQPLLAWGQAETRKWITKYETFRRETDREENEGFVNVAFQSPDLPKLSSVEISSLVEIVSEISPSFEKNSDSIREITKALAAAWVHEPTRRLVQQLWSTLSESEGAEFHETIERLRENLIPESLSLAVSYSQRVDALAKLYSYIQSKDEPDLQALIENFPWLADPALELFTANQPLRSLVQKAEDDGRFDRATDFIDEAFVKDSKRPDFVFLSTENERRIRIFELKSPKIELTRANYAQLRNYLDFVDSKYPDVHELRGTLVGSGKVPDTDNRIDIIGWDEFMRRASQAYLFGVAALVKGYSENPNDARLKQIQVFGGEEVKAFLVTNKLLTNGSPS